MSSLFFTVASEQQGILESLKNLWSSTGFATIDLNFGLKIAMLFIAGLLLWLAIVKKFEPNLLLAMAFGMFLVNIPGAYEILYPVKHLESIVAGDLANLQALIEANPDYLNQLQVLIGGMSINIKDISDIGLMQLLNNVGNLQGAIQNIGGQDLLTALQTLATNSMSLNELSPGLFDFIYKGVEWVIFPPIIFLGIGAMTDFGPLIANPKSLLLGAAAQLGIFITFIGALLIGFEGNEAASIAIIGGADGPTAIYVTSLLAADLLPAIAIAAYSYMALVPVIQPPIMKLLTTKKERNVVMEQLRPVSKKEKILFPIAVTLIVGILLPAAIPLLGMLMLGNLMKESEIVPRLVNTAKNELMNIITIFLGLIVGSKAFGPVFLTWDVLKILLLGIIAFSFGTAGGVLIGKLMYKLSHGKINPLIGAAGVSAVPMAARVAQDVGRKENPNNYLLMHAMGPNVAGVIGSAVAAGVLLAIF